MESFNASIYQYKATGLTVENVSVNDGPIFNEATSDLTSWIEAPSQPYLSPMIHGNIMYRAATNNNSIVCAVIDYVGNMNIVDPNIMNSYHTKYALVSINVQGMSDVIIQSRDDDVDFTLQDLVEKFVLKIFSTNGFQLINKISGTIIMQGGNITGEEDFSIPMNCCILHIIRSSTYTSGMMLPTSHFMLYPWGSISSDGSSSPNGPLVELDTPSYKQLVPYFNVSSYYRSYMLNVYDLSTATYYYRTDRSYMPLCKTGDSRFTSIPALSFSLYGGDYHQYSDDYCTLDVQLVADMISDAVDNIALPDDYVTR